MQPTSHDEVKLFANQLNVVKTLLSSAFVYLYPEQKDAARHKFATNWARMKEQKLDADKWLQELRSVSKKLPWPELIKVATVYCVQAEREHHQNRPDIAWSYLKDAAFYAGAVSGAMELDATWSDAREEAIEKAKKQIKSEGGRVTNEFWRKVEERAVELVKKRGESGERWKNWRGMADSIKPELWDFMRNEKELKKNDISEPRYTRTIGERLEKHEKDIGKYLSNWQGSLSIDPQRHSPENIFRPATTLTREQQRLMAQVNDALEQLALLLDKPDEMDQELLDWVRHCHDCCRKAGQACLSEDPWAHTYVLAAYFYLGVASEYSVSRPKVEEIAKTVFSTKSSDHNHKHWREAKAEAIRLDREQRQAGTPWKSVTATARAIGPAVASFLERISDSKKRFSNEESRTRTIAKWLKKERKDD